MNDKEKKIRLKSPIIQEKLKRIKDDPVLWAKAFVRVFSPIEKKIVPWSARWYQVEMLRDKSLKKVYRCGRRTGKCLPGYIKILDPITGERITVKELYDRGKADVVTLHTGSKKLDIKQNCPVMYNGFKKVYRVTLTDGKTIDATDNHPFYTKRGWKELSELKIKEEVATPYILPYFGSYILDESIINSAIEDVNYKLSSKIFMSNKNSIVLFLKAFFFTHSKHKDNSIYIDNIEEEKAEQISHLLLRLGIHASINIDTNILKISGPNNVSLFNSVLYKEVDIDTKEELHLTDISWKQIVSIKPLYYCDTYDLTVPETHNFVANDIIVHNTETMCIEALYKVNTNKSYTFLFATPFESQIRAIFDRLNEIIDNSPLIKEKVVSSTKNPFRVVFNNNSKIVGFTTGASNSAGAPAIRGQHADETCIKII